MDRFHVRRAAVPQDRPVFEKVPVAVSPPRRTPRAPAKAACRRPALGLGWRLPSRRRTRHAWRALPPAAGARATVRSAAMRAAGHVSASSSRAAAHPNRSYRRSRWPTMASSVLAARCAAMPPGPATAPHSSEPTTASAVFSATDSTAARHSSASSSPVGSRPTRAGAIRRARSRSPASTAAASRRASPPRDRPPTAIHVVTAVSRNRAPRRCRSAPSAAAAAAATGTTRQSAYTAPAMRAGRHRARSRRAANCPKPATGW